MCLCCVHSLKQNKQRMNSSESKVLNNSSSGLSDNLSIESLGRLLNDSIHKLDSDKSFKEFIIQTVESCKQHGWIIQQGPIIGYPEDIMRNSLEDEVDGCLTVKYPEDNKVYSNNLKLYIKGIPKFAAEYKFLIYRTLYVLPAYIFDDDFVKHGKTKRLCNLFG